MLLTGEEDCQSEKVFSEWSSPSVAGLCVFCWRSVAYNLIQKPQLHTKKWDVVWY